MNREEAITILHEALPALRGRFGILDLSIFGSVARNEAGPGSDLDVLANLGPDADLIDLINLGQALEDLLGIPVDLTTPNALKAEARPSIEKDLIHVA